MSATGEDDRMLKRVLTLLTLPLVLSFSLVPILSPGTPQPVSAAADGFSWTPTWCSTEVLLLHYDGNNWNVQLRAWRDHSSYRGQVWCSSSSDLFMLVSETSSQGYCTIEPFDGARWTIVDASDSCPTGVLGSSPFDAFCVGKQGTIRHFDGSIWSNMDSGTSAGLDSAWGDPRSVYAVGDAGTILRYDYPQANQETPVDADEESTTPNADPGTPGNGAAAPDKGSTTPAWVWVIAGLGAAAVLVGAPMIYFLVRRKRTG